MTISFRYIAAAILLLISLVMPLACDASRLSELSESATYSHERTSMPLSDVESPCNECPPSHHCENDCCSNYAPLTQSSLPVYSPTVSHLQLFTISHKLLQVYFSIFVPPQNSTS